MRPDRTRPRKTPTREQVTDPRLLDFYAHRLLGLFHILSDNPIAPEPVGPTDTKEIPE